MHLAGTHDVAYTGATSQSRENHKDVTLHLEATHIAACTDAARGVAAIDNCNLKPEHAVAACPADPHAGSNCTVGLKTWKNFPYPPIAQGVGEIVKWALPRWYEQHTNIHNHIHIHAVQKGRAQTKPKTYIGAARYTNPGPDFVPYRRGDPPPPQSPCPQSFLDEHG